jgi:hypothetical protein
MSTQLDILTLIEEGEALKQKGLQQAVDHANNIIDNWSERIYDLFKEWLSNKPVGFRFMTEDFRMHVECQKKIESPVSKRAYGFICPKAKREGLIECCGLGPVKNSTAHRAFASVWRKI